VLASTVTLSLAAALAHAGPASLGSTSAGAGRAPEIVAPTIEGKTFRLSSLRGKIVVLDFLTPGCGTCKIEAPILDRLAGRFRGRGVKVVIVDVSNASADELLTYYRAELLLARVDVVRDPGRRAQRAYRVLSLGTTFVVGRDGRVLWKGLWDGNSRTLLAAISKGL
jgi:thiol-disulfide isomerase/thioredoxin